MKYYELYTQARTGIDEWVMAFGVEKISTDLKAIDISGIRHLLMTAIQQWWNELDNRPKGSIQLLIGTESTRLFPTLS